MPLLKTSKIGSILQNEETYATSLMALLLSEFTEDILYFEPESIWLDVRDVYGVEIPQVNKDKVQAMINLLTSNQLYVDPIVFNACCQAFNDQEVTFNSFEPVGVEEAAWGVIEIALNDKDGTPEDKFSEEVKRFIGAIVDFRGLLTPPPVLASLAKSDEDPSEGMNQYADDPAMFSGMWELANSNTKDVTGYTEDRLRGLMQELQSLPLNPPYDLSKFSMKS